VREDGKALEEIQAKVRPSSRNLLVDLTISLQLKDATESLASKSEAVITLENQVGELNSSLESAMADAESKQSVAQGLGQEKSLLETQLKEATEALHKLEAEHHEAASLLKSVQQDVSS
jgi:chromosome segregation ATPase